jgi:glycosyl transferase family 25
MKAFIITLKSNQHSYNIARECINQAKKFGIEVDFFDAINGKDFEEHYEKTGIPRPKKKFKKGRLGVLGCFFSHYYLWKKCIEENVPFIILEHDGFFIKKLPENVL